MRRFASRGLPECFSLSADFYTSKIDANLRDGVLKLSIPRREEAQPRRIEASVG
jgi:HSP20 family protein